MICIHILTKRYVIWIYSNLVNLNFQIKLSVTDKSRIFYFVLKFAEIKNSYTVRTQTLPEKIRLNQRAIKFCRI